jgi:phospholipid/cholesterol/gamma-HCH transport system substrate-binding protein
MQKPFRFRYASELAGSFVLLALIVVLAAVFATGNSQGWFEGTFELNTTFEITKGTFGLREGNEVVIIEQPAGHVGKIVPTEDGLLRATFVVKNKFKQFVTEDSVAKVKMKFVAAGDSYVEITIGQGAVLEDGAFILCEKDEEIMETAQKLLTDVQEIVLPLLSESEKLLQNVNGILASLNKGEGIAGALVNDEELSADIKQSIKHVNVLMGESRETFRESTRLIKAAQKSWLIRKHVKTEDVKDVLSPFDVSSANIRRIEGGAMSDLKSARAANDPIGIARRACDVGICLLKKGEKGDAAELLREARAEASAVGDAGLFIAPFEAELLRSTGKLDEAFALAESTLRAIGWRDRDQRIPLRLTLAQIHCDKEDPDAATSELDEVASALKKDKSGVLRAAGQGLRGQVCMLRNDASAAAGHFDAQSSELRALGAYVDMAAALDVAAGAYEKAEAHEQAADRYFRSGRSFFYMGRDKQAKSVLKKAEKAAAQAGDKDLSAKVKRLIKEVG